MRVSLYSRQFSTGQEYTNCARMFRLDIRMSYFTESLIWHWTVLPREVVKAQSLEVFKKRLAVALSAVV